MNISKIAKKYLMSQQFIVDGFEYQFISVEPEGGIDQDNIQFTVNVLLPKKGQSYLTEKFSRDILDIFEKLWKFLDKQFSYYEYILVDGKEAEEIYISPEDQIEIIESLNGNIQTVKVKNKILIGDFSPRSVIEANISFRYNTNIKNNPSIQTSSDGINFYFLYELRDIKIDGKRVRLNQHQYEAFAEVFNEKLLHSDFQNDVDSIVYYALEPSMKIKDYEFYYSCQLWLDKVEGREVEVTGNSYAYNFTPKMFS
jgi:hypothetical protein